MKALLSCFIFAACQLCTAAEDTHFIALSEWSKPISLRNDQLHDEAIRGRLLIVQGLEPAYGGPPTTNGAMTFIELQNVSGACCDSIDVCFAVTNLHCEMSAAMGKAVPKLTRAWGGRGPAPPCWVNLPYNSTIRLFVDSGTMEPLTVYPGGEPWCYWSIPRSDTNIYYLAGTLNLSTHTNYTGPPELRDKMLFDEYRATLVFPKTRITR